MTTTIKSTGFRLVRVVISVTNLWRRLTDPPASVTDPVLRQKMQLLSISLLWLLLAIAIVVPATHYASHPGDSLFHDSIFPAFALALVLLPCAYALGRRPGSYPAAVALSIAGSTALVFVAALNTLDTYQSLINHTVDFVILSSLLLPKRGTFLLIAGTVTALALVPAFVPAVTVSEAVGSIGFFTIVSGLVVVVIFVREANLRTIQNQARQLALTVKRAESANELKTQFLGMVSHELRTPLNNIMGYSDQMLMGLKGDLPPEALDAAERIHRNGQWLNRMIADLLILSRIEARRPVIMPGVFAPADLLREVEQTFCKEAADKALALDTSLDPSLPAELSGDGDRLKQVVFNLVSNAVKFTDKGRVEVRIWQADQKRWKIEVCDTGIGIPEQAQDLIFDKFYQVDPTPRRAHSGAGLGLAIVRELVILMGGAIVVQSQVNEGARFTVTLPLTVAEPSPANR